MTSNGRVDSRSSVRRASARRRSVRALREQRRRVHERGEVDAALAPARRGAAAHITHIPRGSIVRPRSSILRASPAVGWREKKKKEEGGKEGRETPDANEEEAGPATTRTPSHRRRTNHHNQTTGKEDSIERDDEAAPHLPQEELAAAERVRRAAGAAARGRDGPVVAREDDDRVVEHRRARQRGGEVGDDVVEVKKLGARAYDGGDLLAQWFRRRRSRMRHVISKRSRSSARFLR